MSETTARLRVTSRLRRSVSLGWRVIGVILVVWVGIAGWPQLRASSATLREADVTLLLVAAVAQASALLLLSRCYLLVLRAVGGVLPFWSMAGLTVRASTMSRMVPGGGAAAALFAVRRMRERGIADGRAGAAALLNAVLTMASLVIVTALAAGTRSTAAVGWLAGFGCAVVVLVVSRRVDLMRHVDAAAAQLRSHRHLAAVAQVVDVLLGSRVRGSCLLVAAACACAAWVCEMAALWLAVAVVGMPLPVSAVALALGAANAATALPHTPGGIGIVEAAMTAVFVAAGLEADAALAAVLAYRIIGFWLPVVAGGTLLAGDAGRSLALRRRLRLQLV